MGLVGLPSARKEYGLATSDYEQALAAYVRAASAVEMVGLPLRLDDPPHHTQPWNGNQIHAVRDLYMSLGRLLDTRRAFEACRVAAFGESEQTRLVRPTQRHRHMSRRPTTTFELSTAAPATSVREAADRYATALDAYLAAASRRHAAGVPIGLAMPDHLSSAWSDEQIRAMVGFRQALLQLVMARKTFQEIQAIEVIEPARRKAEDERRRRHREQVRAEGKIDQPY
jgi:hypothetical protein